MEPGALDQLGVRLCQRLIGHEIYLDAPALTLLGSGDLGVDLRFANCRFEDRFIPPLLLVARLRNELRGMFGTEEPDQELRQAEVRIGLELTAQKGSRNGQMTWLMAGEDFVSCAIAAEVRLEAGDTSGRATVSTTIEWPLECAKWLLPPLRSRASRRISKWFKTI